MRYELAQAMGISDSENVLNLLEVQLRKVSRKCIRDGSRITASGIESSFGSVNRKSIAVFSVQTSPTRTLVIADVLYRPSVWFWILELILIGTLLGWLLPIAFYLSQRSTVRNALVDVLRRVQTEVEFSGSAISDQVLHSFNSNHETPSAAIVASPEKAATDTTHSSPIASSEAPNHPQSDRNETSQSDAKRWRFQAITLGCTSLILGIICLYLVGSANQSGTIVSRSEISSQAGDSSCMAIQPSQEASSAASSVQKASASPSHVLPTIEPAPPNEQDEATPTVDRSRAVRVVSSVAPEYPAEARAAKADSVMVTLTVDEQGTPKDFRVENPVGFGMDEAAIAAVSQYRFQPALDTNGEAKSVKLKIEVNFNVF